MSVAYKKAQMLNPRMLPQVCWPNVKEGSQSHHGVLTETAFTLFENNLWETLLFSAFIVFTVCESQD